MKHFLLDKNYGGYLTAMGFSLDEVLKKAQLPGDLFAQQLPSLTAAEYFRLMRALDALMPDAQTPIRLASSENIAAFSPPVFAAYCSRNGLVCLRRLAQYKPLIGALRYQLAETPDTVSVALLADGTDEELPALLVGIEFVFLTGLLRRAAKAPITPLSATVRTALRSPAYAEFLGVPVTIGEKDCITFSTADLQLPFLSRNESMWEFFEPELQRRLSAMEVDDSCAARVRSALMELLPSGECTLDDVAKQLGCSRRSLQRRLQAEGTNFQKQLNHTRELLAKSYLAHTALSAEDVAFLLGYQETGSFLRAFTVWTGMTFSAYREKGRG